MPSPFPGMDPYLEQPDLWHQVHNRLIVEIADTLTPQIAPRYRVAIEERVYTSLMDLSLVGIADVTVARLGEGQLREAQPSVTTRSQPLAVQVPLPEEVTERFLEVKNVKTGFVVCVIEILSPKNKRAGEGRTVYITKRQKILASGSSLVEIDLLWNGEPMPIVGSAAGPYRVLVSRAESRPSAELYTCKLQEPLPQFPVPLIAPEPEPTVDLQKIFTDVYDRARFDLAIDYSQPLAFNLPEVESNWVAKQLASYRQHQSEPI